MHLVTLESRVVTGKKKIAFGTEGTDLHLSHIAVDTCKGNLPLYQIPSIVISKKKKKRFLMGPKLECHQRISFKKKCLGGPNRMGGTRGRSMEEHGRKCSDFLLPIASVTLPRSYISLLIKSLWTRSEEESSSWQDCRTWREPIYIIVLLELEDASTARWKNRRGERGLSRFPSLAITIEGAEVG